MKRKILVFIASPGDLAKERKIFREVVSDLNKGFGDGAGVEFEALGWEDTLATTGRRNQSVINEEIDKCDVFILVLYRRWGQAAPDAQPYSSYTEEEFHRALERFKNGGKPEIFVFFKRVDAASEGDAGPQLRKVMDFRKQLEDTRQVMYRYFTDEEGSFEGEVNQHLRAYAKDGPSKVDVDREIVVLPLAALEEVEKAKQLAEQKTQEAEMAHDEREAALLRLEQAQLQMAEDAAKLAKEGQVEFARQKFAKLMVESTNFRILFLAYEFFHRTGDIDAAFNVAKKMLDLNGLDENPGNHAAALGYLGILYKTRGELKMAEEMYWKALELNIALGRKKGMASDYGNLGNLYVIRGKLERAEEMFLKSLELDESVGHKEGMANQYGNLGNLYQTRGELDKAEEMYQKSLELNEALGRKEGMAIQYGNLGSLYAKCREFDRAEEMFLQALELDEALGRKECMATQYGNLGILYEIRGELKRAEEMYLKSLKIFRDLGSPKAEETQGWLDKLLSAE